MDEPEPVWVRHGELSDELLGRVRAASAQQSTMSTCMREEVVLRSSELMSERLAIKL